MRIITESDRSSPWIQCLDADVGGGNEVQLWQCNRSPQQFFTIDDDAYLYNVRVYNSGNTVVGRMRPSSIDRRRPTPTPPPAIARTLVSVKQPLCWFGG
ncbi:hypothetical protein [Nonomuraea endophytica]|uniref:hypothetical protein n=1 Tax=Nonomuraea endophytica TaxID=714136 RepID=UPI0037C6A1CA